jgi:hypothetical protein
VKELRDAIIGIVARKPGVTSAVPDASYPAKIIMQAEGLVYTIDLTNLFNRIRVYPDEDSDKLIGEFTAPLGRLKGRNPREENLVVVLRDKTYVDQISKMPSGALMEPFVGELTLVYMADIPDSMSAVARKDFRTETWPS